MNGKIMVIGALACTICFAGILTAPLPQTQAEAATYQITYKLPPNPEKYLFLNKQMVSITNPQLLSAGVRPYSSGDFLSDMHGSGDPQSLNKMYYSYNLKFQTSKKGFLWNVYDFIGTLPPAYPADVNLDELDNRIRSLERLTSEDEQVVQSRAQIHMDARLKPLIQAGYVMPDFQYFVPQFPKMLELARKDAMKPRAWDWSRDLIHNPIFSKQVAAYRKSKTTKNVNAVYQAVRQHYNLNIHQDSPAIIKSVLDNVK
ncbi:hypothetical protein [Brevibacillus porteri]|uniref:hypothetical protein n=1 Tax=Brevibacillus porteri TaxID=2126350 RepID=UPI00363328BE